MTASVEELVTARLTMLESIAFRSEDADRNRLHSVLTQLTEASTVSLEDIFKVGKLLINCFPGEKVEGTRDETRAHVITSLTNHPNPIIPHSIFYGLEQEGDSEEYLCSGAYIIGGGTKTWLKDTYKTIYKLRGSDLRLIIDDRALPDADAEPKDDGTPSTIKQHPLYDDVESMFANLLHSYCELSLRETSE